MTETKFPSNTNVLPSHAQVVIVGGGIIGCSVAYHLTKLGWRDVVLLERKQLTCGTTWHAAGLVVTGLLPTENLTKLARDTRELFSRLEEETGQATGFTPVGYVSLACTEARLEEHRRTTALARTCGVDVQEISPREIKEMWPLASTDDILAGFYCAQDGRTNPIDTTMALAKGARTGGVQIFEETRVTGILKQGGRAAGVVTDRGQIKAEYVVNCAGMWAREVGEMAGVSVPLHAAEHYYLITDQMEGLDPDLPILEDPDRCAYYRDEVGGLLLGLFEPVAAPWGGPKPGRLGGIPETFCFDELPPDWDRMMPYLERAMGRIPALEDIGIHKMFNGPESFTPDNGFLLGEAPELDNYFVAAGMNSAGILFGGGVGEVLASWIVNGHSPLDLWEVNIDRMQPFQNNQKYLHDRTVETLGWVYVNHWPTRQFETARGIRKSALHDRLADAGACFGVSSGWEYADWFAPEGVTPKGVQPVREYSFGRQNWFEYNAAEHQAAREDVVLFDMSFMSKFLVQGRDAEGVLNRICANNVAVPVGRCVYTQWLNERGTIEADLTVTRLKEDLFLVVTADYTHNHVDAWLRRHIPAGAHAIATDVTSAYTMLSLQGPKSRELLGRLTDTDLSNVAFPFLGLREIDLGYALVKALRLTYVGELGWELYIPTDFALYVYDELHQAGRDLGLRNAGLQTLNTLRIEKAYREMNLDIDAEENPLGAGLGFAVDWQKAGGFIGKEALQRCKEDGPLTRRLVQFLLQDPEPLLYHGEPIYYNGERVGYIASAAYGHTLGSAVGLGYVEQAGGVTAESVREGAWEIDVAGQRCAATASLRPMYDPKNERVRC